ncbi:hypothetical protein JW921_04020 [Candidatus Fermentibacterales bacterium]|nr:hypothetical protein [Candidatus Fermentibacterales bacterium]
MRPLCCIACLAVLLAACGGGAPEERGASWPWFSDTLRPADSIGVEMGDSCLMFGRISGVVPLGEGRLAVLDGISCRVSVFSSSTGDFLWSFGRRGEGPGELLEPSSMTALPCGDLLVHDSMRASVERYGASGRHLGSAPTGQFTRFLCFEGLTDSSFLGYSFDVERTADGFDMGYVIAEYSAGSGQRLRVYFEDMRPMEEDEPDFSGAYKSVATDGRGRVFISDMAAERYGIRVLDAAGSPLDTFELDAGLVEMDMETDVGYVMPVFTVGVRYQEDDSAGGAIVSSRPGLRPFVADMGVDSAGNLWARRGTVDDHVWDVFSPDGEHVGEVVLRGVPEDELVLLHLNRHGMAATLPFTDEYPRVYLFR